MENNGKATIREVVDMLDPLKKDVTEIKVLLIDHLKRYEIFCDKNEKSHEDMQTKIMEKISVKSFAAWLSGASVFIGIVITILKIFNVM